MKRITYDIVFSRDIKSEHLDGEIYKKGEIYKTEKTEEQMLEIMNAEKVGSRMEVFCAWTTFYPRKDFNVIKVTTVIKREQIKV